MLSVLGRTPPSYGAPDPATSSLTSSLSSNAISKLQTFVNISDPIYALHLCRGDVSTEVCRDCLATAAKFLAKECSRELVAVIWYGECMMRYSNAYFFSTVDKVPSVCTYNTQNIAEHERFNQLLGTIMNDLANQASEVPAGSNKFGTKEANFSELQTIYSVVQCTPDLNTTDCKRCLGTAMDNLPWCCAGKRGANVLLPRFYVRYEMYPFYKIINAAPTPAPGLPPLPLPLPPREPEDKSQLPTVSIFSIVAPIVASVMLFFLA
ncbi:hypothetical protein SO802_004809 [Lithocarpus litseifolius]|uniref:Gnk2-homologous domain-containing protein n=1 Tax=Lithocarpus litseifolius TaxID=425828 RepID=A0AAW2DGY7_9ROSI